MSKANKIVLPKIDPVDGKYYISYSQIGAWNDLKSFNLGILGKYEYIRAYFMGEKFPDQGWAMFGADVEDYICYHNATLDTILQVNEEKKISAEAKKEIYRSLQDVFDSFDTREKSILDNIQPLGLFQQKISIDFGEFKLIGFADDCSHDLSKIRDYKTGSKASCKKYYEEEYVQLDLYAMWVKQHTGTLPRELEVCMIERAGNCFGQVEARHLLSVKGEVWYHQRSTNEDRQDMLRNKIIRTATEISDYYKVLQKVRK